MFSLVRLTRAHQDISKRHCFYVRVYSQRATRTNLLVSVEAFVPIAEIYNRYEEKAASRWLTVCSIFHAGFFFQYSFKLCLLRIRLDAYAGFEIYFLRMSFILFSSLSLSKSNDHRIISKYWQQLLWKLKGYKGVTVKGVDLLGSSKKINI